MVGFIGRNGAGKTTTMLSVPGFVGVSWGQVWFAGRRKALLLSGGRKTLAALARALLAGHRLLILNDPCEGIAPALVQRLAVIWLKHTGATGDAQAEPAM